MATSKQLMETTWTHAANFIWLYDATGTGWDSRPGVESGPQLKITKITPEQKCKVLSKGNRIALMLPDHLSFNRQKSKDQLRLDGATAISETELAVNDTDLVQPAAAISVVEGELEDATRTYNPRWFSINLNALDIADPHQNGIALYKNLSAIRVPAAGSVRGNLQLESGQPLAWALLTISIEISDTETLECRAQANQFGDFVIPLREFPALEAEPVTEQFATQLRVQSCALVNGKPNLESLSATTLQEQSGSGDFFPFLSFSLKPEEHPVVKSVGSSSLIVRI